MFSGKINTGTQLLAFLGTGIFTADGGGNLTGHESYTVVTTPCDATISGTYTVAPDGSGICGSRDRRLGALSAVA